MREMGEREFGLLWLFNKRRARFRTVTGQLFCGESSCCIKGGISRDRMGIMGEWEGAGGGGFSSSAEEWEIEAEEHFSDEEEENNEDDHADYDTDLHLKQFIVYTC